ncbi:MULTISPECIES: SDR family oxidoreductase [Streptomyces]|uniref:SDR family oxidoreductase n=1 Tax=Streptomyces TaxID=1883 RepID=UPI001CCCBD16|nr:MULTISPECIES: SDR family oxidoreductase [Streptomyces]MBZ6138237.1 SDR family oxidoreductase [Streptomyces olivaceus]MBZ6167956.1 SDR family oxidoreductase [Streptomyces olivaceus]MBZ6173210.1 SDR family oxidoreductase [Streptomyces olivaceus]MBZ6183578.1 SDR family oxidoreductase [Streptomyces olivaceus]MCM8550672.1 SDR family oxidoreductase [Streptomyces sp. STCH 565 A]
MELQGCTALVTGAGRDLGRLFAEHLLRRGATKVYAGARRAELVDLPGVVPLRLDVTDPASVAAAAEAAGDVTLLINNAGVSLGQNLIEGDLDQIRMVVETHLFGTLNMVRAFAPVLGANGGGAILNVLSNLSWMSFDGNNSYAVAKAAQWSLTNGIRLELAEQRTLVSGLVFGPTRTETMKAFNPAAVMNDPVDIVSSALDGIEARRIEIVADDYGAAAKASLTGEPRGFVMATGD